jgi:hypothetical protein
MEEEVMIQKNLVLHEEFVKYLLEQPDAAKQIPDGATLIFLPEDDLELYAANLALLEQARRDNAQIIVIHVKGLAPEPKSRLVEPSLEAVTPSGINRMLAAAL